MGVNVVRNLALNSTYPSAIPPTYSQTLAESSYTKSLLKKSNTTLVDPSPVPGSWMHRFRRSMP